jgi:beta-glucanase (GH16 family)
MKLHKTLALLFLLFSYFTGIGCKKSSSAPPAGVAPTNLTLDAVISTDGSGKVSFTATADNAVSYVYYFGDGNAATTASGSIEYTYTTEGTNNFTVKVTAKSSSDLYASKSISITVNHVLAVVWSDEFNTDGAPDPAKWGYDIGAGGWGNQELQYYTSRADNAVVINGVLKITAKKEDYSGSAYTSARLLSKGKYEFKYGKVEARAKLPEGVGTWPAIWMLGSDIGTVGWPACGEIDIMEHLGRDLNKIYGTLHYPGRSGGNADGATKVISNATTEFHIYTLEWSPALIKISVDGEQVHSVVNSASIPFNHDFFLIMNIAMGGNFGGAMDPAVTGATMEVDYIRVYQ